MGKSTISMAIFHCYVSSPEATGRFDFESKPNTKTGRVGSTIVRLDEKISRPVPEPRKNVIDLKSIGCGKNMEKPCHKPPIWEWFIPPIKMVMTGGWCKWHCFTHVNLGFPYLRHFHIGGHCFMAHEKAKIMSLQTPYLAFYSHQSILQ